VTLQRLILLRDDKDKSLLVVRTDTLDPWEKLDITIGHRDCTIIGWATITEGRLLNDELLELLGSDVWRMKI